jgi:hypothetical protein
VRLHIVSIYQMVDDTHTRPWRTRASAEKLHPAPTGGPLALNNFQSFGD